MDARPNVLNKILPCYKRVNLHFSYSNGTRTDYSGVVGYALPPDVQKYIQWGGAVHNNLVAGSDIDIILHGWPNAANESGSAKVVVLLVQYSYTRGGVLIGTMVSMPVVEITVPNGQAAYTIHTNIITPVSNMVKNDQILITIHRRATLAEDTYTGNWLMGVSPTLKYPVDKIGALI